ncbi:hypothetical protein IJH16_00235 [Candidatus Saccharibacteria bacterium]|nr:hypothetical protein [Candidatus Saccharibacteria bacterium]
MRKRVKNLNDRRYLKTQKAIDKATRKFIRDGHIAGIKVAEVSKEAKIYTSTFYEHHLDMDEVITQMDERMAAGLAKIVSEMEGTDYSLRILYSKMLFYIHKNKDYYGIVVKQKVAAPLILITEVAKPKILKVWKKESRVKLSDDDLEKILTILEWENCGVVWWWGEKYKFADKKIGSIAKRMTILTNKVYRELKWW